MHYRKLGKTDVLVSEVGLGGNRLGEQSESETHWLNLVRRAVELGINLFDTSPVYQNQHSEIILGQAVGNRDDVVIATKLPRHDDNHQVDLSARRMIIEAEASLRRLQRERIDIYQLHSPSREEMEQFDWAEGMARLREQGKIRLRAVAVRTVTDALWLIEQGLVEVLQITYNIFQTEAEEKLFDVAAGQGIGLLGRMPMARGVLTGKFRAGQPVAEGHRALLDKDKLPERIEQAEDLRAVGNVYDGGMTRMALHFSLSSAAMSAIIPGARTIAQLEENAAAANGVGLPAEVQAKIDEIRRRWAAQS